MTPAEEMEMYGRAMFGPYWKRKTAQLLEVDYVTIWRWTKNPYGISSDYLLILRDQCVLRAVKFREVVMKGVRAKNA